MSGNTDSKPEKQDESEDMHDLAEKNEGIPEIPSFTVGKSNFDKKLHSSLNLKSIQDSTMYYSDNDINGNSVIHNLFITPNDSINIDNNMFNVDNSMSNILPITPKKNSNYLQDIYYKHSSSFDIKENETP